jgi:hypothetical protein
MALQPVAEAHVQRESDEAGKAHQQVKNVSHLLAPSGRNAAKALDGVAG